jgi:hypothetical protein
LKINCQLHRVIAGDCLRLWVGESEKWFRPGLNAVSVTVGTPYRLVDLLHLMTQ